MDKILDIKNNSIVITFPYDAKLVECVKALPERKPENKNGKWSWLVPVEYYKEVKVALNGYGFTCTLSLLDKINRLKEREFELNRLQEAITQKVKNYSYDVLPTGRELYVYQKEDYPKLIEIRRAILAWDVGLGKSLETLVVSKAFELPIVVITQASVTVNFQREADMVGTTGVAIYSWGKLPKNPDHNYVLIIDEAHFMQDITSQRTKATLALALSDHCIACYLATGTPYKNGKPINLFPLLKAIRHPLGNDQRAYEIRYCNAHTVFYGKKRVWNTSGASNLVELHEKTKDVIFRRTKKEVWVDLPDITRIQQKAEVSDQALKDYNTRFSELKKQYEQRVKDNKIRGNSSEIVMLGYLRQCASIAKIKSAVELAQEILDQGNAVVLFTMFVETGEKVAQALQCGFLSGDKNKKQRQVLQDDLQSGKTKALVCTIQAGGVGIDLTAASNVIFIDRPFTSSEVDQAEGRCHARGNVRNKLTSIWLSYGNTDLLIDAMINKKAEQIEIMLYGKKQTIKLVESVSQIAAQVLPIVFDKQLDNEDKQLLSDLANVKELEID